MNLSDILSERLVHALGWTILHSLWQGALIAMLLGLLMIAMRSCSSQSRYFASASALLTIFLLGAVTFGAYCGQYAPQLSSNVMLELPTLPTTSGGAGEQVVAQAVASQVLWADTSAYFRQHLPLLVSVWLLGIAFLLLRFIGGYAYLQRLKSHQIRPASEYWQGTLAYLATEVGIKQKVRLLESALAEMPMLIGWLKPVILLPIGTLSGLSISQVESILAHELAHLKRHDYLVNIFQSMLEIVLFYNPFVWWVSGYIRQERENCCDDIAVGLTGDSLTLVKTLTMLEEFRIMKPRLAMGFAGSTRGGLLSRVRRLLSPKRKASGFSEGFLSAMVLVFCLSITTVNAYTPYNWHNLQDFAHKSWKKMQDVASKVVGSSYNIPLDEIDLDVATKQTKAEVKTASLREPLPALKPLVRLGIADTVRFGKGYMAITDNKGGVKMYKDGKEIPKAEFDKHQSEFSIAYTPPKINKSEMRIYIPDSQVIVNPAFPAFPAFPPMHAFPAMPPVLPHISPEVWEDVEVIVNGKKMKHKIRKSLKKVSHLKGNGNINVEHAFPNEQQWEQYGKQWEQYGKQWEQYGKQWEKVKVVELNVEGTKKDSRNEAEEKALEDIRERQEELREQAEKIREDIENRVEKQFEEMIKPIKGELIKDGFIPKDAIAITIVSDKNGLSINNKKLSAEQDAKYRPLFINTLGMPKEVGKKDNWIWTWTE